MLATLATDLAGTALTMVAVSGLRHDGPLEAPAAFGLLATLGFIGVALLIAAVTRFFHLRRFPLPDTSPRRGCRRPRGIPSVQGAPIQPTPLGHLRARRRSLLTLPVMDLARLPAKIPDDFDCLDNVD
jgi:hypothetical protein